MTDYDMKLSASTYSYLGQKFFCEILFFFFCLLLKVLKILPQKLKLKTHNTRTKDYFDKIKRIVFNPFSNLKVYFIFLSK